MTRKLLRNRRHSETSTIVFAGTRWDVSIGYYDNGVPAEVFVRGAKAGSDFESTARDAAILLSLALQHGVSLNTMAGALTRNSDGTASTLVGAVVDQLRLPSGMTSAIEVSVKDNNGL